MGVFLKLVKVIVFTGVFTLLAVGLWAESAFNYKVDSRFGFDNNVFLVGAGDLGNRDSFVVEITPSVQWRKDSLSIRASAQTRFFFQESGENHARLNLGANYKTGWDRWDFDGQTLFTFVLGPREQPVYDLGRSAWAIGVARERRQQLQNRSRFTMTYRQEDAYLRFLGNLQYFDLQSRNRPDIPGSVNYVDRYEAFIGADLGNTFQNDIHDLWLGVRAGHQSQGRQGARPSDRSNDFYRILLGYSYKSPEDFIFMRVEAGPSFHNYTDPLSRGPTEISQLYLDALVRLNLSEKDQLIFNAFQRKSVNSTGVLSLTQNRVGVSWSHKICPESTAKFTYERQFLNYDAVVRNDLYDRIDLSLTFPSVQDFEPGIALRREWGSDSARSGDLGRTNTRTEIWLDLSRTF